MYLVLHELLIIPKIHCFVLPSIIVLNKPLQATNYAQKCLLNCLIVCLGHYSWKILVTKLLGCSSFSFMLVQVILTFKAMRYKFPGSHQACYNVFFSCEMAENTTRNALFKVCEGLLLPVFNSERKPPLSRSLPVRKCNTGFI